MKEEWIAIPKEIYDLELTMFWRTWTALLEKVSPGSY